jgi:thymidylate synthase (FAD)
MKLIESNVKYLPQSSGLEGVYRQIELAGRTCYKSEDKITENSAKKFVDRLIQSGHLAMLEHGTIYLKREIDTSVSYEGFENFYSRNPYSKVSYDGAYCYVTTNLRVIVEHYTYEDLKYLCNPEKFHEKRYTFRFTTDRGISHELVRHRKFSFAQESQRYCGYDKGKFGEELTFIIPSWENKYDSMKLNEFEAFLSDCESIYMFFRECDMQPQEARCVLPNCIKTEIVMTGFVSDWKHFLDLRYYEKTGKVHPDMKILMNKFKIECENNNIWTEENL